MVAVAVAEATTMVRIKARMDLLLSFSTADAVDSYNELTRGVRLEAGRLVGPVVALAK